MAAESTVLVTIGTAMASGIIKSVTAKCAGLLSETSVTAGLLSLIFGIETQLQNLQHELKKFEALLSSVESPNSGQPNQNDLVVIWLDSVKKAASFADNVLDQISYHQMRRQAESSVSEKLLRGHLRFKIGARLNEFMYMAAKIYTEAAQIGLRPAELVANPSAYRPGAAGNGMTSDLRERRENADTSFVVGRQAEEDLIVSELTRSHGDQVLRVVAMVGQSGVGKTTLARKIYDSETVREYYKKKVWIFVSDNFNLTRFLNEMIQSMTGESHNLSNTEAMEKKLQQCINKERYLLVLDDVWNRDQQIWDSIKTSLARITDGCMGNRVLVTTQSSEVALVMGASLTYHVKFLQTDDARALFEAKAYAKKSQEEVSNLRDIGERILQKCGGLPLAINTLASLVGSLDTKSEWECVERSELWNFPEGQIKIMPWLLLSFNHLPNASVKQCFAHCSIVMHKGGSIDQARLINSWIAQGFIQNSSEIDEMSKIDVGKKYIKSMIVNGLLQSTTYTKEPYFFMHDLIHDLALYVSRDTCLILRSPNDVHKVSSRVEHVRISHGNAWSSQLRFLEGNTQSALRTLLCSHISVSIDLVVTARFLRELSLAYCGLKEISSSIGSLKHLRILDLSGNPFEYLPESIGRLYFLEVLGLWECFYLLSLPHTINMLLNLRIIDRMLGMGMPKEMGKLTHNTHTSKIKIGEGDGCNIKELGSLVLFLGELVIKQLENVSCKEDAVEAGLKMKAEIIDLRLIWTASRQIENGSCSNDEEVMEGLQPHSNLQDLRLEGFGGTRFAPWLSNVVDCSNLRDLQLLDCTKCKQLPTLGLLPLLKNLVVDGMDNVQVMGREFFYGCDQRVVASSSRGSSTYSDMSKRNLFPNLVSFVLRNMPKLKDWFDPTRSCASAFPCMKELQIYNCPLLVSAPSCFHSLENLTISGIHSDELVPMIVSNCYNLTSIDVENVQKLTCLSKSLLKCTSLKLIRIVNCNALVELPSALKSLHCLQTLEVKNCANLTSVQVIEGLSSLSTLKIMKCSGIINTPDLRSLSCLSSLSLTSFSRELSIPSWINDLSNLSVLVIGDFYEELDSFCGINMLPKSLRSLTLEGWPKIKSLPTQLQSLTQIVYLCLKNFEGIETLPEWLGNLFSLKNLLICYCKNLKHLPSLNAMKRLTQLRDLRIYGCPLLEDRCDKEGGEEWPKISHISYVLII